MGGVGPAKGFVRGRRQKGGAEWWRGRRWIEDWRLNLFPQFDSMGEVFNLAR